LAFLETINEDDIFFYDMSAVDKCPTYKKQLETNFAAWLKAKYGTADAWKQAWEARRLMKSRWTGGRAD